jgi:uncharacterized protein YidB (DUF937 family)
VSKENIMGLLDTILGQVAGGATSGQNESLADSVMRMLGNQNAGGINGLLSLFTQKGFGSQFQSWIGTGPNQAISPDQIDAALGKDRVAQIARDAGIDSPQASASLSQLLPGLVDKLTPTGAVPQGNDLEQSLAGLRKLFS